MQATKVQPYMFDRLIQFERLSISITKHVYVRILGTPKKGPMAAEVLANFYQTKLIEFLELFNVNLKDKFGKDIRRLQGESRDLSSALSIVTSERNVISKSYEFTHSLLYLSLVLEDVYINFLSIYDSVSQNEELQLKAEELAIQNHHLTSTVDQQDAAIVELTDKLRACSRSEDENRDRLDRAENKIASMKAREKDFEDVNQKLDSFRTEILGKDAEIKRLKEEIQSQKEQLASMALLNTSTGGGKKKKSGWSCVP